MQPRPPPALPHSPLTFSRRLHPKTHVLAPSPSHRYVYDYKALVSALSRYKVAVVGSGAWACAAVRMIAQNTSQVRAAVVCSWAGLGADALL